MWPSDEAGGILSHPSLPLCVRSNSVLYKGDILLPSDYYNISLEANPNTGTPYGFFHEPLPGGAGGLEGSDPVDSTMHRLGACKGGPPTGYLDSPDPLSPLIPPAGYPDGYPLLIASSIGAQRMVDSLQYLLDGDFLNAELTDSLELEVWSGKCECGGCGGRAIDDIAPPRSGFPDRAQTNKHRNMSKAGISPLCSCR